MLISESVRRLPVLPLSSSVSPFNPLCETRRKSSHTQHTGVVFKTTDRPARRHPRTSAAHATLSNTIRCQKSPRTTETSPFNEPCLTRLRNSSRHHRTKEATSNFAVCGHEFDQVRVLACIEVYNGRNVLKYLKPLSWTRNHSSLFNRRLDTESRYDGQVYTYKGPGAGLNARPGCRPGRLRCKPSFTSPLTCAMELKPFFGDIRSTNPLTRPSVPV